MVRRGKGGFPEERWRGHFISPLPRCAGTRGPPACGEKSMFLAHPRLGVG